MTKPATRPIHDAPVVYPAPASTAIEVGDLLYANASGVAYPASSQSDQTGEPANQIEFASNFIGIANSQRLATQTSVGTVEVIVSGEVQLTLNVAANLNVGDYVGACENTTNDGLLDQAVESVTGKNKAIGRVSEDMGASGTSVWVRLLANDSDQSRPFADVQFLPKAQTIDMDDAEVALAVTSETPAGATVITSNVLYVDANSPVTGAEDLLLPPEDECDGLFLFIANTGGEEIIVKDDGDATTVGTVDSAEVGYFFCDGTTWRGGVSTNT